MNTVHDFYQAIDHFAPFESCESWDNVGLLVGDFQHTVNRVLFALDATISVIEEAKSSKANLLITHHPVMFSPIQQLYSNQPVYQLAQNNIHLIAAHTNWDLSAYGTNHVIANLLQLHHRKPLTVNQSKNYYKIVVFVPEEFLSTVETAMRENGAGAYENYEGCSFSVKGVGQFTPLENANPFVGEKNKISSVSEIRLEMIAPPSKLQDIVAAMKQAHPYERPAYDVFETTALKERTGFGLQGELENSCSPEQFARQVKQAFSAFAIKWISGTKKVKSVGICSGSGGSCLGDVIASGVDAYVTGELSHHHYLEALQYGITVVEVGHFLSETISMPALQKLLEPFFPDIPMQQSTVCTDGVQFI